MSDFYGLNKYNRGVARGTGTFQRFQWVLEGKLARSTQPNYLSTDAEHTLTKDDIQWLRDRKIACVISANHCKMTKEGKDLLGKAGIAFFHFKVEDYQPPKKEQLVKASSVIELFSRRGGTLVYCGYGQGRTGTFIAAWAMIRHMRGRATEIEPLCTHNKFNEVFGVENLEQTNAVRGALGFEAQASVAPPLPTSPKLSGLGMPGPAGLPLPKFSASGMMPKFSGASAASWLPPQTSGPLNIGNGANTGSGASWTPPNKPGWGSGASWTPPPLPTSPLDLGSGNGPVDLGFPDEDNLGSVSSSGTDFF